MNSYKMTLANPLFTLIKCNSMRTECDIHRLTRNSHRRTNHSSCLIAQFSSKKRFGSLVDHKYQLINAKGTYLKQSIICLASSEDDFDIPTLDMDLPMLQEEAGATLSADGVPLSFGNDEVCLGAMRTGVVLVDRSDWGRVRVGGEDRLDFLHNQTTQDFKSLQPGQGRDTVFSTPSGRTVDLATAYVQENSVMLVTSPSMTDQLVGKMNKYIFMADKVTVDDISSKCRMFTLLGPTSNDILAQMKVEPAVLEAPEGSHSLLNFQGSPVLLAVGGGLPVPGFTLIVDDAVGADLWSFLHKMGSIPCGQVAWESARVMCGRPAPGAELSEDFSVLEAGLFQASSLNKGCYLGQETIAKVYNKDAVKQQLWGVEVDGRVEPGALLTNEEDGKRVGVLTSYSETPGIGSGHFALGYVRCRVGGKQVRVEGMRVNAGPVSGVVTQIPFPTREFSPEAAPQKSTSGKEVEVSAEDAAELAAAEERKAKKLAAMEARLAAYLQAQQAQDSAEDK
mmetsp:Transcript_25622/g.35398  ORF Transcript_25622/g.35398 Transcript_25622/m.35398 type:complete len:508 (+) Transcript_25622:152-1675(+)